MNIKPIYVLLPILVAAIIFLIISSSNRETVTEQTQTEQNQMPQDDIHKNLGNGTDPNNTPSRSNVNKEVFEKMDELKSIAANNPNDLTAQKNCADFLAAAHKIEDAILYYDKVLKLDPKNIETFLALSYIYFNKQDMNKAMEFTNKIISVDKNNHLAYYNLGAIYSAKGDAVKAKEIWNNVVKNYPNTESAALSQEALNTL